MDDQADIGRVGELAELGFVHLSEQGVDTLDRAAVEQAVNAVVRHVHDGFRQGGVGIGNFF